MNKNKTYKNKKSKKNTSKLNTQKNITYKKINPLSYTLSKCGKKIYNVSNKVIYLDNLTKNKTRKVKIIYDTGGVYEGLYRDGKRIKGKHTYSDGTTIYEGPFKYDLPHGKGILKTKFVNYIGNFYKGIKFGKFKIVSNNLDKKNGDYVKKVGKIDCNGFTGHGTDKFLLNEYKGKFKNGRLVKGTYKINSMFEKTTYIGELDKDNKRNGKGKLIYKDGKKYEGIFIDNLFNQYGVLVFPKNDLKLKYEGYFSEGEFKGKGKLTYKNGNVYEGFFNDGKMNGEGKFTYKNGDVVEGQFNINVNFNEKDCNKTKSKSNTLTPISIPPIVGKKTYKDGKVYEGEFNNMIELHGKGKMTYKDGKVYEGEFKNNLIVDVEKLYEILKK